MILLGSTFQSNNCIISELVWLKQNHSFGNTLFKVHSLNGQCSRGMDLNVPVVPNESV